MESGYYDKIEKYDTDGIPVSFSIDNYESQKVFCVSAITSYSSDGITTIVPSYVYSEAELSELNLD